MTIALKTRAMPGGDEQVRRPLDPRLPRDAHGEQQRMDREGVDQGEHPVLVEQHEADQNHAAGEQVGDVELEAGAHIDLDTNSKSVPRKPSIKAPPRNSPTRNTRILAMVTSNTTRQVARSASLAR